MAEETKAPRRRTKTLPVSPELIAEMQQVADRLQLPDWRIVGKAVLEAMGGEVEEIYAQLLYNRMSRLGVAPPDPAAQKQLLPSEGGGPRRPAAGVPPRGSAGS